MRYAIVSDIHANQPAWEAVWNDIRAVGADAIVCLGDVVGYGPWPVEVLRAVRATASLFVLGNHDAAVAGRVDLRRFRRGARRSAEWTRRCLDASARAFFAATPMAVEVDGVLFVHAETPWPEDFGYVDDIDDARACFSAASARLIFLGHTHIPCAFAMRPDGAIEELFARDLRLQEDCRYLINVGSVGDPRDGSQEASYAIFDEEAAQITWRRAPFDLNVCCERWAGVPDLETPYFLRVAQMESAAPHLSATHDEAIEAQKVAAVPIDRRVFRAPVRLHSDDIARLQSAVSIPFSGAERAGAVGRRRWWPRTVAGRAAMALVAGALVAAGVGAVWRRSRPNARRVSYPAEATPRPAAAQPPAPTPEPLALAPEPLQDVALFAHRAARYGKTFRLETNAGVPHIGFWSSASDYVVWRFRPPKKATYEVELEYALPARGEGNRIRMSAGREELRVELAATGSWTTFARRVVGQIALPAGLAIVDLRPDGPPHGGLMNFRCVRLRPFEGGGAHAATGPPASESASSTP